MKRLSRRFYSRPAEIVARALLGKVLVCGERAGRIVETEAYVGPHDLAAHSRFGVTKRNRVMWGPGGFSYVYFIYGMYDMFNVVCGGEGDGQAVLVRALEPVRGLADAKAARGPGKLTRALGIRVAEHNGIDLSVEGTGELFIASARAVPEAEVARGPRVGIDYAGEWAAAPLRFWVDGHPAVSKKR